MNNGYWFNGSKVIDVSTSTHIDAILQNPEQFGMDLQQIKDIYKLYDEKLGFEGKARKQIIMEVSKNGWIRVRKYNRPYYWSIQCDHIRIRKESIKAFCNWAVDNGLMSYHDEVHIIGYQDEGIEGKEVYYATEGGIKNLLFEAKKK